MSSERKKKIQATGILTLDIVAVDDSIIEWLNTVDYSIPAMAKGIGITHDHKVKATISLELAEEPCVICGKPVIGDKICQNCGKPICDTCAGTENLERYCPICRVVKQSNQPIEP